MSNPGRTSKEKRILLLEAAFELFKNKGVAETSIDEIARGANYSRVTFYKYFKSREDICLQVLSRFDETKKAQIQAIAIAKSPIEKFQAWGEALYNYNKQHPHFIRIFSFLDNVGLDESKISQHALEYYHTTNMEFVELLRAIFRQGVAEGSIDSSLDMDMSLSQYAYSLRRIVDRSLKSSYSFVDINPDKYFDHFLKLLTKSLRS